MKKKEFKELEQNMIWQWVYEELPKQFSDDMDDDVGHEVSIHFQGYEGGMSLIFENDGDQLELGIGNDATFIATLSDVCGKTSVISLNVQDTGDIEEIKDVVYKLCDIFTTSGDWHAFMAFVPSITEIDVLKECIKYYGELND